MGLGRFRLSREAIDDGFGLQAFEGMVPVQVESRWTGYLEVTAFSEEFAPVPQGSEPPWYEMRFVGEELGEGRIGNWKRQITPGKSEAPQPALPDYGTPSGPLDFRLKVYPNPMRDDGVFVAEDKEIAPYPGVSRVDGKPCYPAIPCTKYSLGSQLEPEFAKELVQRWNNWARMKEEATRPLPGFR